MAEALETTGETPALPKGRNPNLAPPFNSETGSIAAKGNNHNPYGRKGYKGHIRKLLAAAGETRTMPDGSKVELDALSIGILEMGMELASGALDAKDRRAHVTALLDRLVGKPSQAIDVTGSFTTPLQDATLPARSAKIAAILDAAKAGGGTETSGESDKPV